MPSISVDVGWDPAGESFVTIAHKLICLNQMSVRSFRKMALGLKQGSGRRTVRCQFAKDRYTIPSICTTTGWNESQLSASFPSFLLEFDSNLSGRISVTKSIKISKLLRVCPTCFEEGVHLIFHQSTDFVCCPLHAQGLTDKCPKCGEPLCEYELSIPSIKNMRSKSYFNCHKCMAGGFGKRTGHKKALMKAKKELVTQYKNWCIKVREDRIPSILCTGKEAVEVERLSQIQCFADIKKIIQIYECPDWLRDSLFGQHSKNVDLRFSVLKSPVPVISKLQADQHEAVKSVEHDRSQQTRNQLLFERLENLETKLKESIIGKRIGTDSPTLLRGQQTVTWRFGTSRSAVATAFIMLQWAVEDLTDPGRRKGGYDDFWDQWTKVAGRYVDDSTDCEKGVVQDSEITEELSVLWMDGVLRAILKTLLYYSASQGEAGQIPVFHTPSLFSFVECTDCMPMYFLARTERECNLVEVDTFKTLGTFIKEFNSKLDKLGIDEIHSPYAIETIDKLKTSAFRTRNMPYSWIGYEKSHSIFYKNI